MKNLVRLGILLAAFVPFAASAQTSAILNTGLVDDPSSGYSAPNNCNALLKDGVFDKKDVFGTQFENAVTLNRFCSAHYSSYSAANSDSGNLGVNTDDLMGTFGFATSSSLKKTLSSCLSGG